MKTFLFIQIVFLFLFMSLNVTEAQNRFSVDAGVSHNFLTGGFGSSYKNSESADLLLGYSTCIDGLDLTLRSGFAKYKFDADYLRVQISNNFRGYGVGTNINWNVIDIPVMAGAKYHFMRGSVSPYLSCEAGIHIMSFDERFAEGNITYDTLRSELMLDAGKTEKKTEIGFGFSAGAGIEITVDKRVSIDLGLSCNYVSLKYANKYYVTKDPNTRLFSDQKRDIPYYTLRGLVSYRL